MFCYAVYCKDNTVYFALLYALQDDGGDLEPGGIDLFWYLNVKTFSNEVSYFQEQQLFSFNAVFKFLFFPPGINDVSKIVLQPRLYQLNDRFDVLLCCIL
jgi:hypothetical protein